MVMIIAIVIVIVIVIVVSVIVIVMDMVTVMVMMVMVMVIVVSYGIDSDGGCAARLQRVHAARNLENYRVIDGCRMRQSSEAARRVQVA